MPYEFIADEVSADIAFLAWGDDLSAVFRSAGDALINTMIENPDAILPTEAKIIKVSHQQLDLLLYDLLDQLIFYKDTGPLLLLLSEVKIEHINNAWHLWAKANGEHLDITRHRPIVDVKAVTMHDLRVEQVDAGWQAHVVLDV